MVSPALLLSMDSKYDPITSTWLGQLGTRPNNTIITAVDTFIKTCRTDGNVALFDRFWLFAQDVQANAVISIINPTSTAITEVNSPTWAANLGYTGNGSTKYLNTNFNLSTDAVNFTQNAGSMGIYNRTNALDTGVDIGISAANKQTVIYTRYTDGKVYYGINGTGQSLDTVATSNGHYTNKRTSSTMQTVYKNGAELTVGGKANNSNALANNNPYILCGNNGSNTAAEFCSHQIALAYFGGGFDAVALDTAIQTLKTSIGF